MNIKEDYVSFEVAKLLKEKGFDEATNRYYNAQYDEMRTVSDIFMMHWNDEELMKRLMMEGAIAIPTLQMTYKWLREIYKLFIEIEVGVGAFTYSVVDMANGNCVVRVGAVADSFEDTLNTAIKDVLENLI